jgi:hypothetical protein
MAGRHSAHARVVWRRWHIGYIDQLDIEDQIGFRGNPRVIRVAVWNRVRSISQFKGNEKTALAPDLHAFKALIEARKRAATPGPAHALRKLVGLWIAKLGLSVVAQHRLAVLVLDWRAVVVG